MLTGKLVSGSDAFRWISDAARRVNRSLDICSAFLRSDALVAVLQPAPGFLNGRVLVRWQLADFLAGASNFQAYDIATSYGLSVFMRTDFHGKVYSVSPHGIIVGSANATLTGLGLAEGSNMEVCTLCDWSTSNQQFIDDLYVGSTKVDQYLLNALKTAYQAVDKAPASVQEWPPSVRDILVNNRPVMHLLVDECFWGRAEWLLSPLHPLSPSEEHDRTLLGMYCQAHPLGPMLNAYQAAFERTAIYCWLVATVKSSGGEIYFGQLSASLHSALADDPSPLRQDVKVLLQNLLNWVDVLAISEIAIDRPRHSQRVRLMNGRLPFCIGNPVEGANGS